MLSGTTIAHYQASAHDILDERDSTNIRHFFVDLFKVVRRTVILLQIVYLNHS
jgi:hypothetical protein